MKNKLVFIFVLAGLTCFGQTENIQTEIRADNIFDLSIIKVYPDSFPNVSVVFQAKNMFGKPLWTLDKSEIQVAENHRDCKVLRLINISENKPLNIGLVFDHSGSMAVSMNKSPEETGAAQRNFHYYGIPFPDDFIMAIDYAKEGVLGFLNETGESNDSILFVGFSSTVENIYPLTNDVSGIIAFAEQVQPRGGTAFYDALIESLDSLSRSTSKSVIVALSDGQDNSSLHTFNDVIGMANEKDIAIYNIGLGYVDTLLLDHISEQTGGFSYHTNDPEKLKEIYLNIKEQIKSIYQVDYISNSPDSLNADRELRFSFINDTLEFAEHSALYALSEETIAYVEEKERQRVTSQRNKFIYGGVGILLLGFAGFVVYRKKKKVVNITNAYPNPFTNELTLDYEVYGDLKGMVLRVFDGNGSIVFESELLGSDGVEKLSLGHLKTGVYLVQINNSKSIKIIKQ